MRTIAAPAFSKTFVEFMVGALRGSVLETSRPYSTSYIIVRKAIS